MAQEGSHKTRSKAPRHGGLVAVAGALLLTLGGCSLLDGWSQDEGWTKHGLNDAETRHSGLTEISRENVDQLRPVWSFEFPIRRGIEATPIVSDGVMFVTGAWSETFALDAQTGAEVWRYDPQVDREVAKFACCDVVNRGVALDNGKVFLGTLDGRLVALSEESGDELWSVQTTPKGEAYTITGAPRVVKGKVIIGNGGAEAGVRGYVSAYDTETGERVWRFYTVPGNPADGPDGEISDAPLAEATSSWTGEFWKQGGGGTVWDSMSYDAELDLLYIGIGNGSPWVHALRSPDGGDNLFLSSIMALRPDTGEYVWHFQTTPADNWDYTATQHLILSDLELDGEVVPVIMQAPKNGFFYVLDRRDGTFISAQNYVQTTWASGVDPETGRPIETPEARYGTEPVILYPSVFGGHNWQPMAFSPQTGLVYIPANDAPMPFAIDPEYEYDPQSGENRGVSALPFQLPQEAEARQEALAGLRALYKGALIAWDPVAQEERWRVPYSMANNGGLLSTAGGLVFQATADRRLVAYDAESGEEVWSHYLGTGVVAPPITYRIDGVQYVSVAIGWGGSMPVTLGAVMGKESAAGSYRVLTFALEGEPLVEEAIAAIEPVPVSDAIREANASIATLTAGNAAYAKHCFVCHSSSAIGGGVIPDLRQSYATTEADVWRAIVREGGLTMNGMPSFVDTLSEAESEAIRQYVLKQAQIDAGI
ncbi:MAG: PQQ-dependent dehydrogenase, methanol/ethanol family [Pseudomonadota bacterium]